MRFKIDENLPAEAAGILKNAGFEVSTRIGQFGAGSTSVASISSSSNDPCVASLLSAA